MNELSAPSNLIGIAGTIAVFAAIIAFAYLILYLWMKMSGWEQLRSIYPCRKQAKKLKWCSLRIFKIISTGSYRKHGGKSIVQAAYDGNSYYFRIGLPLISSKSICIPSTDIEKKEPQDLGSGLLSISVVKLHILNFETPITLCQDDFNALT